MQCAVRLSAPMPTMGSSRSLTRSLTVPHDTRFAAASMGAVGALRGSPPRASRRDDAVDAGIPAQG